MIFVGDDEIGMIEMEADCVTQRLMVFLTNNYEGRSAIFGVSNLIIVILVNRYNNDV